MQNNCKGDRLVFSKKYIHSKRNDDDSLLHDTGNEATTQGFTFHFFLKAGEQLSFRCTSTTGTLSFYNDLTFNMTSSIVFSLCEN